MKTISEDNEFPLKVLCGVRRVGIKLCVSVKIHDNDGTTCDFIALVTCTVLSCVFYLFYKLASFSKKWGD